MNLDNLACKHCKGLIAIRMPVPSSKCDHLYYPENCEVCFQRHQLKLDAIKKAFKKDAREVKEKVKRPQEIAQKDKQIHEIKTKDKYSGEASPHWEAVQERKRMDEGNPVEHILANPDTLSEETSLYHRPLTEVGELQAQAVKEALPKLSSRQRMVLELCGPEGCTQEEAAKRLGISRLAVRTQLQRARAVIKQQYRRIKLLQE